MRDHTVLTLGGNVASPLMCHMLRTCVVYMQLQGGAKKTGPPYLIANILKIPRPNCVEIGKLLQYYRLNTVINFLFKNFIALCFR